MTVEEMIKVLNLLPQDSKVYMSDMMPILAIHNIDNDIIITDEI